ncbi:acetyl-CoA synthetase-like protein, partial [Diplogelasinospora grovesii]
MSVQKTQGGPYSGAPPGHIPFSSTFDWCFSQPFQSESDYTPAAHRVSHIADGRPIFIDYKSGRALAYAQIARDSRALAAGLSALGLDPHELHTLPPTPSCPHPEIAPVVLIQVPNCLPFAPILLGTFASGLTATLVSPALTSDEIAWILQNARPRVIITARACQDAMREAIKKQEDAAFFQEIPIFTVDVANDTYPMPPPSSSSSSSSSSKSVESDWRNLLVQPAAPRADHAQRKVDLTTESAVTRTAVILWSSGTSGRSKGVLLSHHALNYSTASLWHDADFYLGQSQRWLGYVPFYHVFGLCNVLLLAVCAGAVVYTMPSFSLDAVLAAIPRHKITYLHMAPPVAVMLAKAAAVEPYARRDSDGRNAFSSVVSAVTGGAPLGHEVVVQVHRRLGFRVRLGYGLSEACSATLQRGITEAEMHAQAGDTGRPHWGVEIMIATDDDKQTSSSSQAKPADEEALGEILVRSPGLLTAYLPVGGLTRTSSMPAAAAAKDPDMSATMDALTPDGWFRTGDVGCLSSDGRLRITDRLKELIKVRAYQVAPAELEALLCSSESVADAGVVGVYDESEATEWPRAFVVARSSAQGSGGQQPRSRRELEALAQELKTLVEKRTARYKWLRAGIVFVDQIPKSPSGKILRRVMKDGGVKGVDVMLYQPKRRDVKL